MQNAATLFSVLGNIGAVLGPATGVIMADYFIVRRRLLDVPDLYKVHGRYHSFHGFNLVGLGSLILGAAIVLFGEFNKSVSWLYDDGWFVGIISGAVIYLVLVYAIRAVRAGLPEFEPTGSAGEEASEVVLGAAKA